MGLHEKLESDMKSALKESDVVKLSVMRMLVAAIRQAQIDSNIKLMEDDEVLKILKRQIKQRRDSINQFRDGNRQDLADKEAVELKVLEAYIPEQIGEDELLVIIKASIAESGANTKSEAGKVMKFVMEKTKGLCDGKVARELVVSLLK